MDCFYCDSQEAVKCRCGHFACQEHTYFNRNGNILEPICIDCYERMKSEAEGKG